MGSLFVVFALVWTVTFLFAPQMGDSWLWDTGNAVGFAAFAGLLYLSLPGQPKQDLRAHEYLGYLVLALIAGHGLWFLWGDAAVVEYLKPGAPAYMWTGVLGIVAAALLAALARLPTRVRRHSSYDRFRQLHLALSIAAICFSGHHIAASGFYLQTPLQIALFLLIAAAVIVARPLGFRPLGKASPRAFLLVSAVGVAVFVAVRNGTAL